MRTRRVFVLCLLAPMLVLSLACNSVEDRPPLRVGVNPWPGYEFLFLARDKGFYEQEGGRIQLVEFSALSDARRAYERGQIDAVTCTLVELLYIREHSSRSPKVVLVTDYSDGGDMILASKSIPDIASLAGRRVGLEPGSLNTVILHRALQKHGLSLKDVSTIPLGTGTMVEDMKSGKIDAAVTYPPFSTEIAASGLVHVLFSSRDIPKEIVDILVMEEETLASRPSDVAALLKGFFLAQEYTDKHPEEAYPILAARLGMPVEALKADLSDGIRSVRRDEQAPFFGPDGILENTIQLNNAALREAGQLTGPDRTAGCVAALPQLAIAHQ